MTRLSEIYRAAEILPPFPKVAQRILKLLADPETTVEKLVETLRFDQGMTANILRLSNSVQFGLPRQVSSLNTAVSLLGHSKLMSIIVTSCSGQFMKRELSGYNLKDNELWLHAVGSAVASSVITDMNRQDSPFLFTAALLHDIGKIILHTFVRDEFRKIIELVNRENISFPEAEKEVLGMDHAQIGAKILGKWGFPEQIVESVRIHHEPAKYLQNDLAAMVALSDLMSILLGIGTGIDGMTYTGPEELFSTCGITEGGLDDCLAELWIQFQAAEELLSIR
ncbi:MAG TPA: HDOD domain-containing protein [Thermodesulfobacteriaceae bacterium]|nr:HDOD domain-containing protein [Thermodesulfobacteriaceae bacterium]